MRFSLKRVNFSKRLLVTAGVAVVILVGVAFYINNGRKAKSEEPLTPPQLFAKELRAMNDDVTELDAYLEQPPADLSSDLNQYLTGMQNLKNPCQQLKIYEDQFKSSDMTNNFKDNVSQAGQLCADYVLVLEYSRAVYSALYPYMTLNTSPAQDVSAGSLQQFYDTITGATEGLKQVNSKQVDDPGRSELIIQLEEVQKKTKNAANLHASGDTTAAATEAAEAFEMATQDKTDFLNARAYFWRNTVRIKALQKTIQAQIDQFESIP